MTAAANAVPQAGQHRTAPLPIPDKLRRQEIVWLH